MTTGPNNAPATDRPGRVPSRNPATRQGRPALVAAAIMLAAGSVVLSGCVGYTTYDPRTDHRVSLRGMNHAALRGSIAEALRWTISRYPPSMPRQDARQGRIVGYPPAEQVAVGLPRGLSRRQYLEFVDAIGPVASPLTDETEQLPTYIVGRIELRGGKADIDIHRPVPDGDPGGTHQLIEVSLEGGIGSWRVIGHQIYAPSVVALPEPGRLPEPDPGDDVLADVPADDGPEAAPASSADAETAAADENP